MLEGKGQKAALQQWWLRLHYRLEKSEDRRWVKLKILKSVRGFVSGGDGTRRPTCKQTNKNADIFYMF